MFSYLKSNPSVSQVALDLTPAEVAARCFALPGLVFFDSALDVGGSQGGGSISIIAASPFLTLSGSTDQDWEALREAVAANQFPEARDWGIPVGFAAGSVDYDGAFSFGFYAKLLVYRHRTGTWFSVGQFYETFSDVLNPCAEEQATQQPAAGLKFHPSMTGADFMAKVERAKAYIAAGDIYQVNLAHRFSANWADWEAAGGCAFALYSALRHYSPAPHAALLVTDKRTVLSSSPELFLEISGRHIRTRPIKGTRPRHKDRLADEKSAYDLITSPKEISELVMITDLERNDLGQVCEFGSVTVSELLKLERYEQVFHLVSTVEGQLRPEVDAVSALRAVFPGGSITGAPKKRAREIIAELEPVPRGLYTGALGYFGFNGESQFSIAIRTLVIECGTAHFHVGAGIVADSVPAKEWEETLHKAAGILLAAERVGAAMR